MLPGRTYRPEEILHLLRKRIWFVIVPWALVASGTAGVARLLPDVYKATAKIQYVPPRVLDAVARQSGNVQTLTDRLRATEQVILSRTRLERLVREFNLYEQDQKNKIMEDIVTSMRRDIVTAPLKGDVFTVQYKGSNPVTVMKVTERLASYFIEESLKEGQRRAEGTSSFVEAEVEEKHRQLLEIEDKVRQYKIQHSGELPQQMGANVQAVAGLQNQLQQLGMSMQQDFNRRKDLDRKIDELENQAGPDASPLPITPPQDPSALNGTAQQNLNTARQMLAQVIASGKKETHWEYQKWSRAVQQFQKEVDAQATQTPVSTVAALPPAEAARLRQLASYREEREQLGQAIEQKQNQEKQIRDKVAAYQAKVDQAPLRDAELTDMTREYDTIKAIYESYLGKREAAATSVNLERRQIGEQYTLLDAAQVPQRPDSPDRGLINIFGISGGFALGLALVALLEYRDNTFKTDSELGGALSLPVLAVVPLMMSDVERRAQFRRRLIMNLGLGSTVAVCIAVLAYSIIFMR